MVTFRPMVYSDETGIQTQFACLFFMEESKKVRCGIFKFCVTFQCRSEAWTHENPVYSLLHMKLLSRVLIRIVIFLDLAFFVRTMVCYVVTSRYTAIGRINSIVPPNSYTGYPILQIQYSLIAFFFVDEFDKAH